MEVGVIEGEERGRGRRVGEVEFRGREGEGERVRDHH